MGSSLGANVLPDGSTEGSMDISTVGTEDSIDGSNDGSSVGTSEFGNNVGAVVFTSILVGGKYIVGPKVISIVGSSLSSMEGSIDGSKVLSEVGSKDGSIVGSPVICSLVGITVGGAVTTITLGGTYTVGLNESSIVGSSVGTSDAS